MNTKFSFLQNEMNNATHSFPMLPTKGTLFLTRSVTAKGTVL